MRKTRSMCPQCLEYVDAELVEKNGKAYLQKHCSQCGDFNVRMSHHAWYHIGLDRYFFSVMDGTFPQRDYIIRLSEKCNLDCPICLASANDFTELPDLKKETLLDFTDQHRKLKIDLMSAEPTLRPDLPEMMRELKRQGHIVALHTNGLKLAKKEYVKELLEAGMDEVHLQFDGFEDKTYEVLRGRPLASLKLKVLQNLEDLNIATDLVMVIKPGLNEHEIPAMFEYAQKHSFVRELFFLGLRSLGHARDVEHDNCLMPDDVIDIVAERTNNMVDRKSVFRFQKLYFALLSLMGVRKCLYVQHYLLIRDSEQGFIHAKDLFDWNKVEEHLDRLMDIPRSNVLGRWWWFIGLCFKMLSWNSLRVAWNVIKMKLRLWTGFDLSKLSNETLILGYITACDPFIYDEMVAEFCGKGEIATDIGIHESGSLANVTRERFWKDRLENLKKSKGQESETTVPAGRC